MRSFPRPTSLVPPTLGPQGPGGRLRSRIEKKASPPKNFSGHWTQCDVRGALFAMQGRICAYCGADVSENAVDVEHFRPKGNVAEEPSHGGYWWLAYEFTNYVLSCVECNQKRKGDSFPLQAGGVRVRYADRHLLAKEPRVLLSPIEDPIEEWIRVNTDDVDLLPLEPTSTAPDPGRIREAVSFFGLNGRLGQTRRRLELLDKVSAAITDGRPAEVTDHAIRYRPQSLVVWQLLRSNTPGQLPHPVRELEWLLSRLCEDLILKQKMLADQTTELDERERDELVWALATIWTSPPLATVSDVERYFEARRSVPEIAAIESLVKTQLRSFDKPPARGGKDRARKRESSG